MRKYLIYALILFSPIFLKGQTTSPIQDIIYNPTDTVSSGSTVQGDLSIVSNSMDVSGKIVVKTLSPIKIVNGVLNFNLAPNDTADNVNSYYTANFTVKSGSNKTNYSEKWVVPTSDTPLTLHQIRLNTTLGPASFPILVSQIAAGPNGTTVCSNGVTVSWDTCGGGVVVPGAVDTVPVSDGAGGFQSTTLPVTSVGLALALDRIDASGFSNAASGFQTPNWLLGNLSGTQPYLQTRTVNGPTMLHMFTNGTGSGSTIRFHSTSDLTNTNDAFITVGLSGGFARFIVNRVGSPSIPTTKMIIGDTGATITSIEFLFGNSTKHTLTPTTASFTGLTASDQAACTSVAKLVLGVVGCAAAGTDYQAPITLTTTGSSGAATLINNTLNIPQYSAGGLTPCLTVVSFSSTPNFDFSGCTQQVITLTGNVTPSITNANSCKITGGCVITFIQGSGSYTVTWPGSVLGGFSIGTTNTKRNIQAFTSIDGSNIYAITPGIINQ